MDPLTPLDTLCRIILRARDYEAQTASDYDRGEDPDNVDDEQEGALSVLEDDINDSSSKRFLALTAPQRLLICRASSALSRALISLWGGVAQLVRAAES